MKKLSNDLRKKQCKEAIKISETKIKKHEKTSYHIEVFIKSNNKSRSHNRKLDRSRSRSKVLIEKLIKKNIIWNLKKK